MDTSQLTKHDLMVRNRLFMLGHYDMHFVYSQDVKLAEIELLSFMNDYRAKWLKEHRRHEQMRVVA